jgi:hypothetical protein
LSKLEETGKSKDKKISAISPAGFRPVESAKFGFGGVPVLFWVNTCGR